jgi:hypothetical protein
VSNVAVESSSVGSDQDLPITIAAKPISTRDRNIALATITWHLADIPLRFSNVRFWE